MKTETTSAADIRKVTESLLAVNAGVQGVSLMMEQDLDESEEGATDQGTEKHAGEPHGNCPPDEDECGPADEFDVVDQALEGVMTKLSNAGYSDEDAEEATFDALGLLIDADVAVDTPDMDAPAEEKQKWIVNYVPKIEAKLKEMGLEF